MGVETLDVLADRGYFSGEEILACEEAGVTPICPKPLTSGAKADGRFGKQDFVYHARQDVYRCPAGETLTRRITTVENGHDAASATGTPACRHAAPLKAQVHRRASSGASRAGSTRR